MKKLLWTAFLAAASFVPASLPTLVVPAGGTLEYTTTAQKTMPSNGNITITPSNVNFNPSAWVELTPSASAAMVLSSVRFDPAVTAVDVVAEFGIGAAASEVTIGYYYGRIENNDASTVVIPIYPHLDAVPAGSRLAMRIRKSGTSTANWTAAITYYEKPITGLMTVETGVPGWINGPSGVVTGNTWANGNWLQFSASMPSDMLISTITYAAPGLTAREVEFDLGIGAAASEVVKTTTRFYQAGVATCTGCGSVNHMNLTPLLKVASNGQRLAFRGRSSINAGTDFIIPNYGPTITGFDRIATSQPQKWYPPAANGIQFTTGTSWAGGSWVELTSATAADIAITSITFSTGHNVCGTGAGTAGNQGLEYELGTGAAASEVVRGTYAWGTATQSGGNWNLPIWPALNVPTGTRIAIRGLCGGSSSRTPRVALGYIENPDFDNRTNLIAKTLPFNADGAAVTPNGSAWADSAWAVVTASLANDTLVIGLADASPTATVNADAEYDIGTGAAAAEVTATTIHNSSDDTNGGNKVMYFRTPHFFPRGTRLSVRLRKEGTATAVQYIKLLTIDNYTPPTGGLSNPVKFCCEGWPWVRPSAARPPLTRR